MPLTCAIIEGMQELTWPCDASDHAGGSDLDSLRAALENERRERRRAQCLASIQSGAVQLAPPSTL